MDKKYAGSEMIVFHYSNKKPIPGNIIEKNNEGVALELPLKNLKASINAGDPMVVVYKTDGDDCQFKGCCVTGVFDGKSAVEVKIDTELKGLNHRLYERLPVSIYADIKDDERKKRYSGILKDISKNGLLLYSKEMMTVNSHVEINVFLENRMVFLKACVVRTDKKPYYNCYGLCVPKEDVLSVNNLNKCFRQICENYLKKLMEGFNISMSFDRFEYPNVHPEDNVDQMLYKSVMKLEYILKRSKY